MKEKELVTILENIATLLEIRGDNPFKAKAYSNAADIINSGEFNIEESIISNSLSNIPGIGKALQSKITEFYNTGKIQYYEELIKTLPPSLAQLTKVYGIGSKKAKMIYEQLGISSVDELEIACENNEIRKIKGITPKIQEMMLNSIAHIKASKGRFLQQDIRIESDRIISIIKQLSFVDNVELSSSMRRFVEVISEIYIVVATSNQKAVIELINKQFDIFDININNNILFFRITDIPITLEIINNEDLYWRLFYTSGSTLFINSFIKRVEDLNYEIIDGYLFKDNKKIVFNSENEIFDLFKMQYIYPEQRESSSIIDKSVKHEMPELIKLKDLKGMLHIHTNWSDGSDSIIDMAKKAKELGFEYIAICDHSKSATYAGGLNNDRVRLQHQEIDRLNKESIGIKILKGIESDILIDGSLDYPDDILSLFDIVIASVHSGFDLDKDKMTDRIIKVLKNPYTTILGHPTGRLLLSRPGYQINIQAVIETCLEYNKIIEINANPYRLDLSWEYCSIAIDKGVRLAINPDSHTAQTMQDVGFGVNVARKAGCRINDIINTMNYEDFVNQICRKKFL